MKIAFYKSTRPGIQGLFNRLVRWWTNGFYSHCEIVISLNENGESLCASSSFIDGGIRFKKIKLNLEHWDFIEYPANEPAVYEWFMLRNHKKYDVLGLYGFLWRRADGNKNRWHCSESVAEALGFKQAWRFDPNTLACVLTSFNLTVENNTAKKI